MTRAHMEYLKSILTTFEQFGNDDECASLRAAVAELEWRPIADAPWDWTAILAIDASSGFIRFVRFYDYDRSWRLCGSEEVKYPESFFTHFRPLPAGPEGE